MIELELNAALALYSGILFTVVAALWLYTSLRVYRPQRYLGKQYLWRCTICGFAYLDEEAEHMSQCPRCQSYNAAQDRGAKAAPPHAPAPEPEAVSEGPQRAGSKRKRRGQRRGARRRR